MQPKTLRQKFLDEHLMFIKQRTFKSDGHSIRMMYEGYHYELLCFELDKNKWWAIYERINVSDAGQEQESSIGLESGEDGTVRNVMMDTITL